MKKSFYLICILLSTLECNSQIDTGKSLQLLSSSFHKKSKQDTISKVALWFVGAGDIQKSISSGTELAANTGLGVILRRQWKAGERFFSDFDLDFSINVASTVDTISAKYKGSEVVPMNQRDFGTYILLPMNSGQATRFKLNAYTDDFFMKKSRYVRESKDTTGWSTWSKKSHRFMVGLNRFSETILNNIISGVSTEFIASNRVWQDSTNVINATGLAFSVGVFHDFIPNDIRKEEGYSIKFGVSYIHRGIYGDAGFKKNANATKMREKLLGNGTTQFGGVQGNLSLQIKRIEARVLMTYLASKEAGQVPGLSQYQFLTSITFSGGFPIKLQKTSLNDSDE
jgi:hypothetical protein